MKIENEITGEIAEEKEIKKIMGVIQGLKIDIRNGIITQGQI